MDPKDRDEVKAAVAAGVQAAFADPATWETGIAAIKRHLSGAAERESGRWLIGWGKWLMKKLALGVAIIAVLYYTGGLPAVAAWLKVGK